MPSELHYLNVKKGDCSWIKHPNGNNTVIDVFNASIEKQASQSLTKIMTEILYVNESIEKRGAKGNFRQKDFPVNPIEYIKNYNIDSIFRFVLSHPDMDHLGGIEDLFKTFKPINFWDINNQKEIDSFDKTSHDESDWEYYKNLRNGSDSDPIRLELYSGSRGKYYNQNGDGSCCGNGLFILAPTPDLVAEANRTDDYNDCSYVILYRPPNGSKVIISGDSHNKTWEHILNTWEDEVKDCDVLLAPHHGRHSKRSYEFLDILKPKITFFGIAKSDHLGYSAWSSRSLPVLTNNQGNCLIAKFLDSGTEIRCTYEKFAKAYCSENGYSTNYDDSTNSYFLKSL